MPALKPWNRRPGRATAHSGLLITAVTSCDWYPGPGRLTRARAGRAAKPGWPSRKSHDQLESAGAGMWHLVGSSRGAGACNLHSCGQRTREFSLAHLENFRSRTSTPPIAGSSVPGSRAEHIDSSRRLRELKEHRSRRDEAGKFSKVLRNVGPSLELHCLGPSRRAYCSPNTGLGLPDRGCLVSCSCLSAIRGLQKTGNRRRRVEAACSLLPSSSQFLRKRSGAVQ